MPDMEGYIGDAEDLGVMVERFTTAINDDDAEEARAVLFEIQAKAINLLKDLADIVTPEDLGEVEG